MSPEDQAIVQAVSAEDYPRPWTYVRACTRGKDGAAETIEVVLDRNGISVLRTVGASPGLTEFIVQAVNERHEMLMAQRETRQ